MFSRGFNFVSRWIGIILPIGGGTDDKEYDDCEICGDCHVDCIVSRLQLLSLSCDRLISCRM